MTQKHTCYRDTEGRLQFEDCRACVEEFYTDYEEPEMDLDAPDMDACDDVEADEVWA